MRKALLNEVTTQGRTIQKYSLIQIRKIIWTMAESAKNTQYLRMDSLSSLFSMSHQFEANIK